MKKFMKMPKAKPKHTDKNKDKNPDKSEDKIENKSKGKKDKKVSKATVSNPTNTSEVMVKFGKPLLQVNFKRIKLFVTIFVLLFILIAIFSINLLITAVQIRSHLGSFINMVSKGDGEILPSLLALPVFGLFSMDIGLLFFIYKIFSKQKSPRANNILFIFILVETLLIVLSLATIFATFGHIYSGHKGIENGVMKAMEKYSVNSYYKKQVDRLQIEFQCCGSKKYDDWYNVTWLDKDLSTNDSLSQSGTTPFSCCSMKSKFPCIHFDIEKTGVNYIYTPEFNLSISTTGCYLKLMEKKQQVGLGIVASLVLYTFLEIILLIPARFLQTGHSVDHKFEGNSKTYTVWLVGSYSGRHQANGPPEPPPVPPELMD